MGKDGKYQFDSGRARSSRHKDLAQLEFDDMLIDEFYREQNQTPEVNRRPIPVRFGADQLAAFMDDSTIASALIRDETFDADEQSSPLTVEAFADADLFEFADHERAARPEKVAEAPPVTVPIRPARPSVDTQTEVEAQDVSDFTLRGVAAGFAMGAVAAACVLVVLSWLV